MNEVGYESKVYYLEMVTGHQIVEKQDEINVSDNMKVVASQIFPRQQQGYYDAFIYYKVKQGTGVPQEKKQNFGIKV